jgi:hypothetical protein
VAAIICGMTARACPIAGRFGGWQLDLLFTYQSADSMTDDARRLAERQKVEETRHHKIREGDL